MNNSASKSKTTLLMILLGFVAYNVVVFALGGFEDHGGAFWVSYAFMLIAFLTVGIVGYTLSQKSDMPKDWLLGYPIIRHSAIFIVIELIASAVFMYLDYENDIDWKIALAVQTLILAAHIAIIFSCFKAKEKIEDVQANVKAKTSRMKFLQVDVEMVAANTDNMMLKQEFAKLAEQVRFSDPVSNELLYDIENQIAYTVEQAKTRIAYNDVDGALALCQKASQLLLERNKKCKILK